MSTTQQAYRIFELDRPTFECWVCHVETFGGYSVPVYEDFILPTAATLSDEAEWGGTQVCKRCFDLFTFESGEPVSLTVAKAMALEVGDKDLELLVEKMGEEVFRANDQEDAAQDVAPEQNPIAIGSEKA